MCSRTRRSIPSLSEEMPTISPFYEHNLGTHNPNPLLLFLNSSLRILLLSANFSDWAEGSPSEIRHVLVVRSMVLQMVGHVVNMETIRGSSEALYICSLESWSVSFSGRVFFIFLTYMAGVIPVQNSGYSSRMNTVEENPDVGTSESSGRETDFEGDLKSVWDVVKGKLLDSLDAVKRESTLGNRVLKAKPPRGKPPLSLYAISEGPQLYLLWSCFQKLEEETNKISNASNSDEWMVSFTDIVREAYQGACTAWLKKELRVENTDSDKGITPLLIKMLNEKDAVFDKIRKSGKEDLFAEFLYFHRFGSSGKASCYDLSLFRTHGVAILEDFMITLADGVASIYLELISVDSKFSNEMNTGGLDICNLSSRALQKLRNEVALYQWLHQNMEAVVSMYEDRFDLYVLQTQVINNGDGGGDTESRSWWRKFTPGKTKAASSSSPLRYSMISDFSLPVKRTKELKALSGWRYYFSLFLELADIGMPIIRVVLEKVSSIISFFLVTLIGRSVGLIFTGIRQSLRWK
ncbi:unnamed protein product [Microthlaspi erraticum]|uniref:Uncharacterized protein n=1 Tax=Microthlaspi erraticum TaxID=1685480 RepID=A0A6D2L263_9BRAS|nr:unnamed protein product [Microthlaspi erraticum]